MDFTIAINRFEKLTDGLQEGRSQLRCNCTLIFNYNHEDGIVDPHQFVADTYGIRLSTFEFLGETEGDFIESESVLDFTRSVFFRFIPGRRWNFRRTLIGRWMYGRDINWQPLYRQSTVFNINTRPDFRGDLSPSLAYNLEITSQEFESETLDVRPANVTEVTLQGNTIPITIPREDRLFIKVSLIERSTGNVIVSKNSRVMRDTFFGDNEPRMNRTA